MAHHIIHRATMLAASGATLPSFVLHAWEADALSAVLTGGDPVTTWTDSVSGVVRQQTTTSLKPTWSADYSGSGYPAVVADGVDDIMVTTTNVDLTAGHTYFAVFQIETSVANYRVLYEISLGSGNQRSVVFVDASGRGSLQEREGAVTSIASATSAVGLTKKSITAIQNNASSALYIDRSSAATGTVTIATTAEPMRSLRGSGVIASSGFRGALFADYIAPAGLSGAQLTEMWDYLASKWGTP